MNGIGYIRPSLNEFKVFYNEKARVVRPELQITNIEVYDRHLPYRFFIPISNNAVIFGCMNHFDGTISQIAVVRDNDGTNRSKYEFLLSLTLMIESVKPNIANVHKSKILKEISFFDKKKDIFNTQVFSKYEDMNFMLLSSKQAGFFSFTISYQ